MSTTFAKILINWEGAKPLFFASVEPGYKPGLLRHEIDGEFSFSSVNFSYSESEIDIFNDLSFHISSLSHTAFVGPSGCGKSTIIKLMLGFYPINSGQIYASQHSISSLDIKYYRRQFGIVMQNPAFSSGTIRSIICCEGVYSDDYIWSILESCSMSDDIFNMPSKLDTVVNSSSSGLSGGQLQRLAIARALIRSPKVLIMDEATSALDNASQAVIKDTVDKLAITRISIAHRISTIRDADHIIAISDGKCLASGVWDDVKNLSFFQT